MKSFIPIVLMLLLLTPAEASSSLKTSKKPLTRREMLKFRHDYAKTQYDTFRRARIAEKAFEDWLEAQSAPSKASKRKAITPAISD